jgi:hypothetical protein
MPGTGRSVTTLPLRQVWAYAPNVLMIYGDSNNARFWKPYLAGHAKPTPTWMASTELPDLTHALFSQLGEMFQITPEVCLSVCVACASMCCKPCLTWYPVPHRLMLTPFGLTPCSTALTQAIAATSTEVSFAYWERCTAFWRAGCNITGNIDMSVQPLPDVPIYFASDIWSAQQVRYFAPPYVPVGNATTCSH